MEAESDKLYAACEGAMDAFSTAAAPGAFLVDSFPIRMSPIRKNNPSGCSEVFIPTVKYVPEWFPGAGFKRFARLTKQNLSDSIDLPFLYAKESFRVRGLYSLASVSFS